MGDEIMADLIRTDHTSIGVPTELDANGQPPSTIEHEGVCYGLTEYQATKGVAVYHERK